MRRTLEELCYVENYTSRVVREAEPWTIGTTAYPSYPIDEFETDEFWICLEGRIYDDAPSSRAETLERIVTALFSDDESHSSVRDWLRTTDGEFVLYALEKATGRLAVLNDVFGRLPMYYADRDGGPVFTREIGYFFESPLDTPAFDRHGLAQTLLFGYTLRDRTLWGDVTTIPPGTQVIVEPDGTASFRSVAEFDFDEKRHADKSVEENAKNLAKRFRAACEDRSDPDRTNLLSLSGGHDSRSIAAAFHASDVPCSAATFVKSTQETSSDVEIAREISRSLDVDWELFTVDPVQASNADTLLTIKRGLNHLGLAFLIDFFEQLRAAHGSDLTYFTGDGGDKTLPDLSPAKSLSSSEELVSYTIARNSVFPLEDVAAITGLDRDQIVGEVAATLSSYPESKLANKYVHFLTHERGFSWLFEGEDRNRYYFWSTSPFYSAPFFTYAMNVPDEQKAHNRLYREFLRELWPRAIEFDDADFGTPMASPRYKLVQYGLSLLGRHPSLEDIARVVYRGEVNSQYHPNVARLLSDSVARSQSLETYLDTDVVRRFTDDTTSCDNHQIYLLLTVTAAILLAERRSPFAGRELPLDASALS
ncbi:asparagine synthase-related protein [Natrinema thermotolerans]